MKILLSSVPFRPSIGGIEAVSAILADRFSASGHDVVVATRTSAAAPDSSPYAVLRRPSHSQLWRAVRWADVILHNNISLRAAWPLAFVRKPWVIAHHVWTPRGPGGALVGRAKHRVLRFATNIAVSDAVARSLDVPATVIGNPYDAVTFKRYPDVVPDRDVVFLGRLVTDKGVDVLISAIELLSHRGIRPSLTIIGQGPEEPSLRAQVARFGLGERIVFAGSIEGIELAKLLSRHRILVVPSVWEEPFGIVALEGIACGLAPVVTRSGGLPDAIGRCGVVVPKSDVEALANAIAGLHAESNTFASLRAHADEHLRRHRPEVVAAAYLSVLEKSVGSWQMRRSASRAG